jgi:nicotinamidase-related amidase
MLYLWQLAVLNKHKHRIWPTHCVVGEDVDVSALKETLHRHCAETHFIDIDEHALGDQVKKSTRGHELHYKIRVALRGWIVDWKEKRKVTKTLNFIDAGQNINTESYSVFKAEVQNHNDPSTGLHHMLLASLNFPNTEILIGGEALSHVVLCSLEDFIKKTALPPGSITLLLNCTSIVPKFLHVAVVFIRRIMKYGVRFAKVAEAGTLEYVDTSNIDEAVMEITNYVGRHPHNRPELKTFLEEKNIDLKMARMTALLPAHISANVDICFVSDEERLIEKARTRVGRYGHIGNDYRQVNTASLRTPCDTAFPLTVLSECIKAKVVMLQLHSSVLADLEMQALTDPCSIEKKQNYTVAFWIILIICKLWRRYPSGI